MLRGRTMKKANTVIIKYSLLSFAILFAFSGLRVSAQTKPDSVSATQAAALPARITQTIDETQLVTLKGNVHPLARPEFDRGVVDDSTPMNRMLMMLRRSPAQQTALQQLMLEQQSKDSPNFHQWLTPQQFGAQFGPADTDVQTVTGWLAARGFQNIKVGQGRTIIEFSGNVGQVRAAFHTDIHLYLVNGETHQANASDPQLPGALTPVVAGIVSLNNFPKKSMRHTVGTFRHTADGRLISDLTGSTNQFFAVGPADFAKIYNIPPALNGTGSKIAIVGFSDINIQDVRDFRTLFGLPANDPVIVHNGPAPGIIGEEGEADLDVEWSGAVAPMAEVDFVVSEDTQTAGGLELSSLYVVDNNTDDIVSLSFGTCEAALGAENTFFNALWEQAAAQGITVTASAGDGGSAGCDDFTTATAAANGLAVSGIASTPFNIAVGGTDFDDVGTQSTFWNQNPGANDPNTRLSVKGYIPETTWNDSCAATATTSSLTTCVGATTSLLNIVAASGGPSTCGIFNATTGLCVSGYPKPAWQTGTGVPADGVRDTPDVSLFASDGPLSNSFYLVCQADALAAGSAPSCNSSGGTFSFIGVGGTSASAPSFAGVLALIEQSERTRVPGSSGRQGNANLVLYKIAQTAGNSCSSTNRSDPTQPPPAGCVFNDVTKGNNSVPCAGGSLNCSSTTSGTNGVLVTTSGATKTPAFPTTAGYDLATGLGTVNVTNLAAAWGTAVGAFKGATTALTINGGISPAPIPHGTAVTLAATVTPTSGTVQPTGDVSFIAPTTVNGGIGDVTLTAGTKSLSTTFLPGGTYSVTAHYAGDGTFAPSDSNAVPVIVNKESSKLQIGIVTSDPVTGNLTSANATTFAYGSPYILRMDILNSTGTATNCQPLTTGVTTGCAVDATGTVTVTDNGSPLDAGTFGINSAGHAEDQPIQLAAGTHSLSASYSGDISYNAAGPVADPLTVTKAATATQVTPSVVSVVSGGSITLTANVATNSSGAGPTGTVQFKNGSSTLLSAVTCAPTAGTSATFASCTATLTTTLSFLAPPSIPQRIPAIPSLRIWIMVYLLILAFLLSTRRLSSRRRGYAFACLMLLVFVTAGITGCGGGSGGGGGTGAQTRSITAVYSGDVNYVASTSAAVSITIQ
jgi:subtilase family serine protease